MKKEYAKFVCEECQKESSEMSGGNYQYPYDSGWVYIYNLEFKTEQGKNRCFKDKHFCSQDCQRKWINGKVVDSKLKPNEPLNDPMDYELDN